MPEQDHPEDHYLHVRQMTDLWQSAQLHDVPIKLEAQIPPKEPTPDLPGGTRTNAEIDAILASQKARKEKTVESPEVQAIRQQFKEHTAKIGTGELALEHVGKAGRSVAEAVAPGVEVAGRAMGLDEEGAAALSKGLVEFIAGLPGGSESDLTAGMETALAALPMVGAAVKGWKAVNKLVGTFEPSAEWLAKHVSVPSQKSFKVTDKLPGKVVQTDGNVTYTITDQKSGLSVEAWAPNDDERFKHMMVGRMTFDKQSGKDVPSNMAVTPEFQRKGIASRMAQIAQDARGDQVDFSQTYKGDVSKSGAEFLNSFNGDRNIVEEFRKAAAILKSERGSVSVGTKTTGKAKLPGGGVETPITWEEAIKIDESRTKANGLFKDFSAKLTKQTQGVRTDVQSTAESLGPDAIKLEEFLDLPPGSILKDSNIIATKRMFKEIAEGVRQKALWMHANPNDRQALLALLEEFPLVEQATLKIAGVFKEPPRSTRLLNTLLPTTGKVDPASAERLRISDPYINQWLEFFKEQNKLASTGAPALTQEKLIQILAGMQSPEEFIAAAKVLAKPSKWDMFIEYWINGLLSGPATHATNILSNAATIAWGIPERQLAAMFSKEVRPSEAGAMLGGILEAQGDAWRLAWKAFKAEESQLGLGPLEVHPRAITADALELTGVPGRAVDFLGSMIRLPGRTLMAADDYFKSIAFRAELRALAKRESFKAVTEAGLSGQTARTRMRDIEERILANPPEAIEEAAKEYASYVTFTRELGETGQRVQALANTPVGRLVLPFVRTPTNIFKYSGERTPLAFASQAVRDEITAGGSRRALALAKISLGAMTMSYMGMLASEGILTGGGPKDKALRAEMMMTGWQPYSIKVGTTYYKYGRISPIADFLSFGADAADLLGQLPQRDAEQLAAALVVAISRNISQKTFVKGLAGTLNAVASQDLNVVKGFFEQELPTILPASTGMGQLAREIDPVMREVNSILDAFKAKVPGLSSTLPPRRNLWGEPIMLEGGLGPDLISPIYMMHQKFDPVSTELVRLEMSVGMPRKVLDGVPLKPFEYDAYVVLSGSKPIIGEMTLKERLADLMQSDLYKRSSDGPDGGKKVLIQTWVSRYRDMAGHILHDPELSQSYLGTTFPDLIQQLDTQQQKIQQRFNAPSLQAQ